MKIALAQIDPTVGDFTGNLEKIVAASRRAAALNARLTVFSELAICGYPPADFLEKPSFLARCRSAVDELAEATRDLPTAVLAGVALPTGREDGKPAFNAAVLLDRGHLLLQQRARRRGKAIREDRKMATPFISPGLFAKDKIARALPSGERSQV